MRLCLVLLLAKLSLSLAPLHAQPTPLQTRAYRLHRIAAETARVRVLTGLGESSDQVQINADRYANQLVIMAPANIHERAVELLAQLDKPELPATATTTPTQRAQPAAKEQGPVAGSQQKIELPLRTLSAKSLHARLENILRRRLVTSQDATGKWLGFQVDQVEGEPIVIWANSEEKQVQLSGPTHLVPSWNNFLSVLDTPTTSSSTMRTVVAQPGSEAKIRQAVNTIESAGLMAQKDIPENTESGSQRGGGDPANPRGSESVGVSLLGPVQIESVEGTDILLLRGNPRDVQRVLDVIEDIERMSELGEPAMEVVPLEHVEADALSVLLKQVFSDNGTKYGHGLVGVYPLARPNSILLIALPTTLQRAKETLAKLDQPGREATQFETFPLKHAKAADARQVVEDLFTTTETDEGTSSLAPKAQVIADGRTNSLIVRASPRDLREVRELVDVIDRLGSQSVNDLRIFRLQTTVAEDLAEVLQEAIAGSQDEEDSQLSRLLRLVTIDAEGQRQLESGVLADAQITASVSGNALIVSAPTESMPLLEKLISQLDRSPDAAIEMKIFPLENSDAASLVDTLSELFSAGGDDNGNQTEITRLRIEVDERTNSLLVAGTRDDLITVEAILRTLDSTEQRQRTSKVYRLSNKRAEDLAEALNLLLEAEREVLSTAPGAVSPFEQIDREILVVPEYSGNSLLISATPSHFEMIDRLIFELDVRDEMVMIQVLIAEIELGDIDEFGVELGLQDSVLFDRSLLGDLDITTSTVIEQNVGGSTTVSQDVIQAATNTPGFDFGDPANGLGNAGSTSSLATASSLAGQALSSFGVGRVSSDGGFGGLVLSASSNSINMLLRALQESRRLEVLSRPQIMALNNQEGSAFVGQLVPFITSSTANTITGQPINTVDQVEVGLSLLVTPRISPDGLVVMDITATNNRLRPLSEGVPVAISPAGVPILQPIQDAIQARTVVSAMSGQTVVLSGLITKEDNALHRRVPILADIPLLGDLFRFDSVSTRRRELLIVMTPHVVKSRYESEMLKQVESARMNWCLSDVVNLHGPAGLRSQTDRAGAAEAETVYPDQLAPEAFMPLQSPVMPQLPAPADPPVLLPAGLPVP